MLWLTIKYATILVVETKFACDSDFLAERRERFSDKLFLCIRTVDFGCVKKRDAVFMGCTNDLKCLEFCLRRGRSWRLYSCTQIPVLRPSIFQVVVFSFLFSPRFHLAVDHSLRGLAVTGSLQRDPGCGALNLAKVSFTEIDGC